jgi:hypothetical protein
MAFQADIWFETSGLTPVGPAVLFAMFCKVNRQDVDIVGELPDDVHDVREPAA